MASGAVRKGLQDEIISICTDAVGPSSSAPYKVETIDKKLTDQELSAFPYLVVNVRNKDQDGPSEFGTVKELWKWEIHIYYLDINEDYDTGETRRDKIVDDIETALEINYRINHLRVSLNDEGNTESVYDSNFSSIVFDSSGQEDYFTFVSELYLTVDTQRN